MGGNTLITTRFSKSYNSYLAENNKRKSATTMKEFLNTDDGSKFLFSVKESDIENYFRTGTNADVEKDAQNAAEFIEMISELGIKDYKQIDKDGNGVYSEEEFMAFLDKNEDLLKEAMGNGGAAADSQNASNPNGFKGVSQAPKVKNNPASYKKDIDIQKNTHSSLTSISLGNDGNLESDKAAIDNIEGLTIPQKNELYTAAETKATSYENANGAAADLEKQDKEVGKKANEYLEKSKDVAIKQEEVTDAQENVDLAQQEVDSIGERITSISDIITSLDTQLTTYTSQLNAITVPAQETDENGNVTNQDEINNAESQRATIQAQIDAINAQIEAQEALKTQEEENLDKANDELEKTNDELDKAKEELDKTEEEAEQLQNELNELAQEKDIKIDDFNSAMEEYNQSVADYNSTKSQIEQEVQEQVKIDRENIKKLHEEKAAAFEENVKNEDEKTLAYGKIWKESKDENSKLGDLVKNNQDLLKQGFETIDNYYQFLANAGYDSSSTNPEIKALSESLSDLKTYQNLSSAIEKVAGKGAVFAELTPDEVKEVMEKINDDVTRLVAKAQQVVARTGNAASSGSAADKTFEQLGISKEELALVVANNLDLSETLDDGSPRYLFAKGAQDGKYHIYDQKSGYSTYYQSSYASLARIYGNDGQTYKGDDITASGNGNITFYNASTSQRDVTDNIYYYNMYEEFESEEMSYITSSPLSFDLNGDGVKSSDRIIKYDIDGDGKLDNIYDSADAVLVFDKDKDGISGADGSETFGDNTDLDGDGVADGYKDGFEALKALAFKEGLTNGVDDNELDEDDLKFLEDKYGLKIKVNGYNSDASSLFAIGISQINLASTNETTLNKNFDDKGNDLMTQKGATFVINGEEKEYADLWHRKLR